MIQLREDIMNKSLNSPSKEVENKNKYTEQDINKIVNFLLKIDKYTQEVSDEK